MLWYDRRGYGESAGAADAPVAIDGHIADLLDVLDGRRAVVVGHSFGGVTAMGAAARAPHSVAALVLYETSVAWVPGWDDGVMREVLASDDPEAAGLRVMLGDRYDVHERRRTGPPSRRCERVHRRGSFGAHRNAAVRRGRHPGAARVRKE